MNSFYRKRSFLIPLSILLFLLGIILFNGENAYAIVRFINRTFSLHLNEEFRAFGIGYVATLLIYASFVCLAWMLYQSGKIKKQHWLFISVSLLVVHYTFHVLNNAVNYPIFDDQGGVIDFLNQYTSQHTAGKKLGALLLPYNEAWMLIPRLFIIATWKIFNEINFTHLFLFNIAALVFLFLLLCRDFLENDLQKFSLIIALLLFQLQSFNTAFIAISGLCYYWVLIFACYSFRYLQLAQSNKKFLAPAFACAAALTFGNGLLLFPISILYLLSKKRWREAAIWSVTLLVFLTALSSTFSQIQFAGEFTMNPSNWFNFIPGLLGTAFQFFYTLHIPMLMGFIILFVFALSWYRRWHHRSPVAFLLLAFLPPDT